MLLFIPFLLFIYEATYSGASSYVCNHECNGDYNAVTKFCPNACPPTCADPDTTGKICIATCLEIGCECKPGFILSEIGGQCIDPYDCPGGFPSCGENKTYVDCFVGCPFNYCPVDDSRFIAACDVSYPCPLGCGCDSGYLMLSYEDPRCIKSEECPPVKCTRSNEVWDPAPSNCYSESCKNRDSECIDFFLGPPRCVCESGFYRNDDDFCVPAYECVYQQCNDINASPEDCPSFCQPTCDNPDTSGIICTRQCLPSGCVCNPGYILDKPLGTCIRIEDCPSNQECNGDYNAVTKVCPNACPPTCADPDTTGKFCIAICLEPGCECKPGFILSDIDGQCIDPYDCPGGLPSCGENKTYVDCFVGCPSNYCPVDDSRGIVACAISYPCPLGCGCNPGYLMLSYDDTRCVKSEECPPVKCTRSNEVWNPAPSNCYSESCKYRDSDCIDFFPSAPRCVCESGFYRNDDDVCVPAYECDTGCNGDPNAIPDSCPSYCPATCDEPNSYDQVCIEACDPSGCVCKPGYILTKKNGKCVLPEECPEPTCPLHERYVVDDVSCVRTCGNRLLPWDALGACAPFTGCVCKTGYLRKYAIGTGPCITEEQCPHKQCNDINASPENCPSFCQPTCEKPDTRSFVPNSVFPVVVFVIRDTS